MKKLTDKIEAFLEWGGTRREVVLLVISGAALLASIFELAPLPFDPAWVAIVLCGVPIILEAFVGLVTAFDIKADVLVSLALIASVGHRGGLRRRGGGLHYAAGRPAGGPDRGPGPGGDRAAGPPDAPDRPGPPGREGGRGSRPGGRGGGAAAGAAGGDHPRWTECWSPARPR